MEEKVHRLMDRMQIRHAHMRNTWYGPVLSPVLLVAGFALLIVGIIILPTPAPRMALHLCCTGNSLVGPPTDTSPEHLVGSKIGRLLRLVCAAPCGNESNAFPVADGVYGRCNGQRLLLHGSGCLAVHRRF